MFKLDTLEERLEFLRLATGLRFDSELPDFEKEDYQTLFKRVESVLSKNIHGLCLIGEGIHPFYLDPVVEKAILTNPRWYSPYTPYQPEISQGRLRMLWYFQEFFRFYSGHDVGVASMLDLGSATSDAILSLRNFTKSTKNKALFINEPLDTVVATVQNRIPDLQVVMDPEEIENCFCIVVSLPDKFGETAIPESLVEGSKKLPVLLIVDPFYLIMHSKQVRDLDPAITVGSAQRLGCPMWFGGPYPAFLTAKGNLLRHLPGRIVGKAKDKNGKEGFRLAVQTREQHIRKDRATSNICTSQSLTAILVVAHLMLLGRSGVQRRVRRLISTVKQFAELIPDRIKNNTFFDTLSVQLHEKEAEQLRRNHIFCYNLGNNVYRISFFDQMEGFEKELETLCKVLGVGRTLNLQGNNQQTHTKINLPDIEWPTDFPELTDELEFNRFIAQLERQDYSHLDGMIPLGSCTMKLNSAKTLVFLNHPGNSNIHPLQPADTITGYKELIEELGKKISALTGFSYISFHPNSGAQGELCALITIRKYFKAVGTNRWKVLIPMSAHGTNFASASLAGFKVEQVKTNCNGSVDIEDLQNKLSDEVACVMLTYPSTFGVFDEQVEQVNQLVKSSGAFSYLDGANFNAFMGWLKPKDLGFDVCHLNLHKTFGIPHGGGGPGACAVGFCDKLQAFAPKTIFETADFKDALYTNSSPFGNAGALVISLMYINLLGAEGLRQASYKAVANANYLKSALEESFDILAVNKNGFVAHEFLLRFRELLGGKITVFDIAKRLIDYGFHPPTINWPVQNCLMIEPTETENTVELDRFVKALLKIKEEINKWQETDQSPVKNAPHALYELLNDWPYSYSPKEAFPNLNSNRFVAPIKRLNEAESDREMLCLCEELS